MPDHDLFDLSFIFAVIRRWWRLIAICTILSVGLVYIISSKIPPAYDAEITLLVEPSKKATTYDYTSLVVGERLAITYSQMLVGNSVLDEVITRLDLPVTPDRLARAITTSRISNTQLIRVSVQDTLPERAALIANTLAEVFITQIQEREAARYTESLSTMQTKMDAASVLIEETQAEIDGLNAKNSLVEAELYTVVNALEEDRTNYQLLTQESQDLESMMSQLMDYVKIIEPAKVLDGLVYPRYTASVTFFVGQVTLSNNTTTQISEQLIATYAEMLKGRSVLGAVVERLSLVGSSGDLAQKVTVETIPDTQLLRLYVQDSDSAQAELLASEIADEFITQVQAIVLQPYSDQLSVIQSDMTALSETMEETQDTIENLTLENIQLEADISRLEKLISDSQSDYRSQETEYEALRLEVAGLSQTVSIAEPAQVPTKPTRNIKLIYTVFAGLVVLALTFGLALLLEYLNDTLRTKDDLNKLLGSQPIASIDIIPKRDRGLLINSPPQSPGVEQFRLLATNLRYSSLDKPLKTLLVTSASPQEGKSLTVANLAVVLAKSGSKVIAVDADLRIPQLHLLFDLEESEGLTDALVAGDVDGKLRQVGVDKLSILTCGHLPPDPAEVINSSKMGLLLSELTKKADWVLIDCPPILPVLDSIILSTQVDGVLFITRAGQTRGRRVREAVENLRKVNANVVGFVLNAAPKREEGYYYYYSREGENGKKAPQKGLQGVLNILRNWLLRQK